jgi:hypothetical protein
MVAVDATGPNESTRLRFGLDVGLEKRPRAVAAGREEADFAKRLGLFRDLGLALTEEVGELANRELLFRTKREKAQTILISEETKQISPSRQHDDLYIPSFA